jgi:hypothetical protein
MEKLTWEEGQPPIEPHDPGPILKSRVTSQERSDFMDAATIQPRQKESLIGLISGLREDVRNLFQQEIQLAKKEISEKMSIFSRNAVSLAIGGVIGLFGLTFLLLAISIIISYGFESLGLSSGIALFIGFLLVALVTGAIGGILVGKALSAFSKESLIPERTIETLHQIKDGGVEQIPIKTYSVKQEPKDTRSSDQIKTDVERTRSRIGRELRGLRQRLTLAHLATQVTATVKNNPLRSVSIGIGTGVAGYLVMRLARFFGRRRMA